MFIHRRSVAERGGCFQQRLFVCQFVSVFVWPHDKFRTTKHMDDENAVRCIVQKSYPTSTVKVKGQKVKVTRYKKNEKLLSYPHW